MSVEKHLNEAIANFTVSYYKLHRFHWFVQGPLFFELHALYQKLYEEAAEHLDDFAERLLAIGGKPVSTLKDVLNTATISEQVDEVTQEAIAKSLIKDYSHIAANLKQGIKAAEAEDDDVTADMFVEAIEAFEKHIWMLNQSLK